MNTKFLKRSKWFKTGLFINLLMITHTVFSQIHPVANGSGVNFTIHNFGFKVTGKLDPPQGDIRFNPDSLSNSFFHVTIKSGSINTDNNQRDEHLRGEDYFDVKNHPLITFKSDNIRSTGKKNEYEVSGKLTIKNTTKNIVIPFTANETGNDIIFNGSFKMDRRDFGIGGSSTISNDLTIEIKVLARP
jgi:polyisoprenoid-binding protein YceI